jgi:transcriptional regulator of aromatic amino acid metabolism
MEAVKRSCAFVIRMDMPLRTAKAILDFLADRNILIESLQVQVIGGGEAIFILHSRIEQDRIAHVRNKLEKIDGILGLELLEIKGGHRG